MKISVIDPNTLNLDPDPDFSPFWNPDPGLRYQQQQKHHPQQQHQQQLYQKPLKQQQSEQHPLQAYSSSVQSNTFPTDAEEIQQKLFVLIRINLKKRTDAIKFCNAFAVNV